jgi:quercetin dioxygenase-like cupin family protein
VTVRSDSSEALEVEATYGPHGSPPPKHLHPSQDEHFEVLEGHLVARVAGVPIRLDPGGTLEIPAGTPHQMWNDGADIARVAWKTSPAGRTHEWFRAIDTLHREGRVGKNGMPGPLAFAVLLNEYRDVFRLAGPPDAVTRVLFGVLAPIGRMRGYGRQAVV